MVFTAQNKTWSRGGQLPLIFYRKCLLQVNYSNIIKPKRTYIENTFYRKAAQCYNVIELSIVLWKASRISHITCGKRGPLSADQLLPAGSNTFFNSNASISVRVTLYYIDTYGTHST